MPPHSPLCLVSGYDDNCPACHVEDDGSENVFPAAADLSEDNRATVLIRGE